MNLTVPAAALKVAAHTGVSVRQMRGIGHGYKICDARRLLVCVATLMDKSVVYADVAEWLGRNRQYIRTLMDHCTNELWDLAERMAG